MSATKRKAEAPDSPLKSNKKRAASPPNEEHGVPDAVIQRAFYPPEISNERCAEYTSGTLPKPLHLLTTALQETSYARSRIQVGENVVFWFKRDLRLHDNRALAFASDKAHSAGVPLICIFIVSPQDYQAHLTSPARVDFELRTLAVLQADLAELNIPLYTTTIAKRKDVSAHILQKCQEWKAKHVYCNIEYEVDELRRETALVRSALETGIAFTAIHDDVVVPPEALKTLQNKPFTVYSPWFRAWIKHLHSHPHLLELSLLPPANPASTLATLPHLFHLPLPSTPANKTLPTEDRTRLAALWPAGEHEARARLSRFLASKSLAYKARRNFPSESSTAMLSAHFAAGTLSARTAVRAAREANTPSQSLDAGEKGITSWISEIAWRDSYKHILCHFPYVCMHKPFKTSLSSLQWKHDPELFAAWCAGRTGYPLIDAAMRQLNTIGYMHNRCRMITASFLAKDLLLDWRLGERYFMEHLIDGDFASNSGGWGFSASVGVDPQPYFRVFNPVLQSEKFDAEGVYIRKWVRELEGVEGRSVHDPYGRGEGELVKGRGYPRMVVVHSVQRARALEMYKGVGGKGSASLGDEAAA